jgi:hypothetical protein
MPWLYFCIPLHCLYHNFTQFSVFKCNLVFVLHYHFHATYFGNSLQSSGVVPLTIALQLKNKIHNLTRNSCNRRSPIREDLLRRTILIVNIGEFSKTTILYTHFIDIL